MHLFDSQSSMLRDAFKAQTDMQTELTLAKSNLQLALANNEMLEDALKRDPARRGKNCAVVYFGEGAASEGDFHAGMLLGTPDRPAPMAPPHAHCLHCRGTGTLL